MRRSQCTIWVAPLLVLAITAPGPVWGTAREHSDPPRVCTPVLETVPVIELGESGLFTWTCARSQGEGSGYYVVFIRPAGTYVLLKVPRGRTSFEFTPDTGGMWRWIVINTDPDTTRPDVESQPGYFQVVITERSDQ